VNAPFVASTLLLASLCLGGSTAIPPAPALNAGTALVAPGAPGAPASLSLDERAQLHSAALRDADLGQVRAGFEIEHDDLVLILGTAAVVLLIVLIV
jgi:hypothetical protein